MSISVLIVCDKCGQEVNCGKGRNREKVNVVRCRLQREGWLINSPVDICSKCRTTK
jgi:hypothetical protein